MTFYSDFFILLQVIQEPEDIVENGLSVYNPVLVGAISYVLIPRIYGAFDAFSFLLVFLATILRYIPAFHIFIEYFENIVMDNKFIRMYCNGHKLYN